MVNSDTYTQAKFVHESEEYGYDGSGMVVAIIDSGIDPSHRDFVLDDDVTPRITNTEITDLTTGDNPMLGKYFTEKVPFGRNYMDGNNEIRDLGVEASMHGMHVAGTVGANGDVENGGIRGVAPNAQLLALKVFGNDPEFGSTYSDTIIAAIDDAILLGADVMNLSIGATSAWVDEDDPEQRAIARAVDAGIIMSISAGNSSRLGAGFGSVFANNPDIGVVGAPSVSTDSLSVASINNDMELLRTSIINNEVDLIYLVTVLICGQLGNMKSLILVVLY